MVGDHIGIHCCCSYSFLFYLITGSKVSEGLKASKQCRKVCQPVSRHVRHSRAFIYLFNSQLPATLSKQKKHEISNNAASTLPTAGPVHWVHSSVGKQHLGRHCALGLPKSFYLWEGNTKNVNKIVILPGATPHRGRSLLGCSTVNRNDLQASSLPSLTGREFIRFFEAGRVSH